MPENSSADEQQPAEPPLAAQAGPRILSYRGRPDASDGTVPQRPNGWAIASLVSGLLVCIPFLPASLAIIAGILGLRALRDPLVAGKRMATIGLGLGIVGLMFWAWMLQELRANRDAALRAQCMTSMRQIYLGIAQYQDANGGQYPDRMALLPPTIAQVAQKMSGIGHTPLAYSGKGLTGKSSPKLVVLYEPITNHGGKGANFMFADGHAEFIPTGKAQKMVNELTAGQNPPPSAALTVPPLRTDD